MGSDPENRAAKNIFWKNNLIRSRQTDTPCKGSLCKGYLSFLLFILQTLDDLFLHSLFYLVVVTPLRTLYGHHQPLLRQYRRYLSERTGGLISS